MTGVKVGLGLWSGVKEAGGQNRTDDLRFTKPLLYRLSHAGAGAIVAGTERESSECCSGRGEEGTCACADRSVE